MLLDLWNTHNFAKICPQSGFSKIVKLLLNKDACLRRAELPNDGTGLPQDLDDSTLWMNDYFLGMA